MIIDIIVAMAGISLITWRKPFSQATIEFQNKNFGYKFGKKDLKISEVTAIFIGILMVAFVIIRYFKGN